LRALKERMNGQTQRMRREMDGLKVALEKKEEEKQAPAIG
jgi:hypothetical protein